MTDSGHLSTPGSLCCAAGGFKTAADAFAYLLDVTDDPARFP